MLLNMKYISICLNGGISVSDYDNHNDDDDDDDDVEHSAISHLPTPAIWHCRPPRSPTLKPEAWQNIFTIILVATLMLTQIR